MRGRLHTVVEVLRHFASRQRFVLIPLLIVLLLSSVLLVLTGGLGYVAPFVYALF
ncbi:MAG TPA: DUF5989 family protein [Myxococcota bacterium]